MQEKKDCKILFNTLAKKMWKKRNNNESEDIQPLFEIYEIISFILKLKKVDKFFDLNRDNKFLFLEAATVAKIDDNTTIIDGYFKSARSEFRPDLINKKNGNERKNPKEITEGDIEKTHFLIKIDKNEQEVYLFLEYNFHGVNTNNVINYFSNFLALYLATNKIKRSYSIIYLIIPRNDFLSEIKRISRTRIAEVFFDKQLLGSQALNFSNRLGSLKKELKLVASASVRESITEVGIDFYNAMNGSRSKVSKVRVYGNDNNNNEIVLDTSFTSKVEFFEVDVNKETGELNSAQVITGLRALAKDF